MRQVLDDPEGWHDSAIVAEVDLAASDEAGSPAWRTLHLGQRFIWSGAHRGLCLSRHSRDESVPSVPETVIEVSAFGTHAAAPGRLGTPVGRQWIHSLLPAGTDGLGPVRSLRMRSLGDGGRPTWPRAASHPSFGKDRMPATTCTTPAMIVR